MKFYIEEKNNERVDEVKEAIKFFKKYYTLKPKNAEYVIKKIGEGNNEHFQIYPIKEDIKIEEISPKQIDYSIVENILLNTDKDSILKVGNNLYRILKSNNDRI
jgi:hypothetical protein